MRSIRGWGQYKQPDQGGERQSIATILRGTRANGAPPWQAARLMKVKFVFAGSNHAEQGLQESGSLGVEFHRAAGVAMEIRPLPGVRRPPRPALAARVQHQPADAGCGRGQPGGQPGCLAAVYKDTTQSAKLTT